MNIKRLRKHYKEGDLRQKQRIERLVTDQVELASLIFDGDIEIQTVRERKAYKTAERAGVNCFEITDSGILPLDKG